MMENRHQGSLFDVAVGMLSIAHRFLFVHVPKTAGNSVQSVLAPYSEDQLVCGFPWHDGVERFEVVNPRFGGHKHLSLAEYQLFVEPEVLAGLFKFATIRNPWERVVSNFFSSRKGEVSWDRDSFLQLVRRTETLRQFISLDEASGAPVDGDLDFLMRYETLEDDFREVCRQLGIAHRPLPHRNRSFRQHYSRYYDEELKEVVRQRFSEEIAFGGYEFEEG